MIGAAAAALACLALSAPPSVAAAALSANPDGPLDVAAVDRYIQSEIAAQRIPGLALSMVRGDRIVHVRGFGQADASGR